MIDRHGPSWKILIVEDEALLAEEIQDRLRKLGHQVAGIADTGEKAIALAEIHRPDLVLMDIRIKGHMDGIETANRIHNRLGTPVIFSTAHSDQNTLQRALKPAQFGYIIKPMREQDLVLAIRLAMHRHHAQASLQKTQLTYAAILASITESVIVADTVGAVRFMNLSAEEFLGRHIVETLGEHADTVLSLYDESGTFPAPLRHTLQNGNERVAARPHVLGHSDGRKSNIMLTLTPIHGPGGKKIGTAILIKDRPGKPLRA